jgi:hypothetical protein
VRKLLLLAALGIAIIPQAHAQRSSTVNGTRLLQICESKRDAGICDAYINGVSDAITVYQQVAKQSNGAMVVPEAVCVPSSATGVALRQKVVEWLRQHGPDRNRQAGLLVYRALRDSYPCK